MPKAGYQWTIVEKVCDERVMKRNREGKKWKEKRETDVVGIYRLAGQTNFFAIYLVLNQIRRLQNLIGELV